MGVFVGSVYVWVMERGCAAVLLMILLHHHCLLLTDNCGTPHCLYRGSNVQMQDTCCIYPVHYY